MKYLLLAGAALVFSAQAMACGFRLDSGKLLRCGMQRIDVIAVVGEPLSKNVEVLGIDSGEPVKGETTETWIYRLQADIGGQYLVSLTLQAGKVVAINRKQLERI